MYLGHSTNKEMENRKIKPKKKITPSAAPYVSKYILMAHSTVRYSVLQAL